jgi:hypothetical protein
MAELFINKFKQKKGAQLTSLLCDFVDRCAHWERALSVQIFAYLMKRARIYNPITALCHLSQIDMLFTRQSANSEPLFVGLGKRLWLKRTGIKLLRFAVRGNKTPVFPL